jgi:hypothetical protein
MTDRTINGEAFIPLSLLPKPQRARGGPVMRGTFVVVSNGLPNGYEPPSTAVTLDPPMRVYDRRPGERFRAMECGQTEPFLGRTPAEAAENLRIKLGHCPHGLAEEVRLITGEIVAAVCPTCLEALPASFVGSHWKP